jgi:hypothetical protein
VVVQDLVVPRRQRAAHGRDLGDIVALARRDGVVQQRGHLVRVIDQIYRSHRFFGQPRPEDLVVRITDAQAGQQLVPTALIEAFVSF